MALANACIWFGIAVLLTDSTDICLFRITSLGWSQILAKINEGILLFILSIFVARESQCLQWSRLAKFLGQAANFEVQLATTTQQQHNFAFYAASTCTWELCSGGGDLLKVQPGHGHSIGPRKLWTHLLQDDGEPEAGQSVQGS